MGSNVLLELEICSAEICSEHELCIFHARALRAAAVPIFGNFLFSLPQHFNASDKCSREILFHFKKKVFSLPGH